MTAQGSGSTSGGSGGSSSSGKSVHGIAALSDSVLGSIGKSVPPSETIDHSVRYFGTWSGSDKLMMTAEYTAKLLAPLLEFRATLQFSNGLRDKPISPTAKGLQKFAGTLSAARRVSGLWGVLPIIKWISAIERSHPASRSIQTIERAQALSMLAFYTLENLSFFTSASAPVLAKYFSPRVSSKASLWSLRAWAVYTILQLAHLKADWKQLRRKERVLGKSAVGETTDVDVLALKKQKTAILMSAIENLAFLPLTIHWSFGGRIFESDLPINLLNLVAALASFNAGWDATALPVPIR
ncbi:uncharacterized protein EI90DRAFT_2966093 [Cantharellus anzutake]|uniref:uncharacterized protein n=1 Tax=Cantharellus anzutake TaxID=1750568 RepID=UPI00190844CD|nr:uncharacterized protein EI90DRAFT_2966093 [Cantharellus anzutake]KAF8340308.1 hypothetical protein EI90DRAFT_2966093 [Cantharellus anzutake]